MDNIHCQCMTILIILLLLNMGLVIGVFLKWQSALKKCQGRPWRSLISYSAQKGARSRNFKAVPPYSFVVQIVVDPNYGFEKHLHCGGIIVGRTWALTAGHCVELLHNISPDKVIVTGIGKLWETTLNHEVVFMTYHEDYNNLTYNADVGLVKVKEPFHKSFEKQIKIAGVSYEYKANKTVTAVGWIDSYYKEEYRIHSALNSVEVTLLGQQYCNDLYKSLNAEVTESMFCAGSYKGEKPACHFDSGGPLLDGKLLVGMMSWGRGCGRIDEPAVYTRISLYEKWIYKTMKNRSFL